MKLCKDGIEIKNILFRYADEFLIEKGKENRKIKGFLYKNSYKKSLKLYENGESDGDDEYCLVADDSEIKKGDVLRLGQMKFYIAESSPLCITASDAGVTAKAVILK